MKIDDPKYFKLKIEDVKYRRNEDGTYSFSEWTGYGPIIVPFNHKVYLNRGTRKPKFTMKYGKKVLWIDLNKYLTKHMSYLKDKEEKAALGDYSENIPKEKQLDLFENIITKFEKFVRINL